MELDAAKCTNVKSQANMCINMNQGKGAKLRFRWNSEGYLLSTFN